VLSRSGELYRSDAATLEGDLVRGMVRFHAGSIGGVMPRLADLC